MSQKPEIISLSEFARRMDIGEKTIRDAIKKGKLERGITTINGKSKIIFDIARVEFEQMNIGAKAKYGIETENIPEPLTSDDDGDDRTDSTLRCR